MLDALMPKTFALGAALIAGIGTLATSVPEASQPGNANVGAWGGIALGAFSVMIAITGIASAFLDRRKIESAKTSLAIIAEQAKTIEYLEGNAGFLRGQLSVMQSDVDHTRTRAHKIADEAHAKLLAKTSELATLRSWCIAQGIEIPEFPHSEDEVIFPETHKETHEKSNT